MKKHLYRFVALIFCLPLMFLSGCLFFDENSTTTGISSINGYKLCYNNNSYEIDNTYEIYATTILTELYACFGIPSDAAHSSQIDTKPLTTEISNYDKIRVQTTTDGTTTNIPWLWTFATSTAGAESLEDNSTAVDYYGTSNIQSIYFNTFVNSYKVALEIACLQIVMGETPTIFTIDVNNTTGTTKVYYDTQKTMELTSPTQTVLATIKQEFSTKGKYVGMTAENIATLKNYILQNVMGSGVVGSIYDGVKILGRTATYNEIITKILAVEAPLEKSIFEPYPANYVKDITNTSLYIKSSGTDYLENITSYEYASIVIMPNASCKVAMLSLAVESEYAMDMTIKLNVYNTSSGLTETVSSQEISVKAGAWSASDLVYVQIANILPIDDFENNGNLQASSETVINNSNGNNKYFKINENNVGILDGGEVSQSYAEIVFEIQKTMDKSYYPFKIGLNSLVVV